MSNVADMMEIAESQSGPTARESLPTHRQRELDLAGKTVIITGQPRRWQADCDRLRSTQRQRRARRACKNVRITYEVMRRLSG